MKRRLAFVLALALALWGMPALAVSDTLTMTLVTGEKLTLKYEGYSFTMGSGDFTVRVSGFGGAFFRSEDGLDYCPVEARLIVGTGEEPCDAGWVEMSTTGTYTFHFETGAAGFSRIYLRDATKPSRDERDYQLLYDSNAAYLEARYAAEAARPDEFKREWFVSRLSLRTVSGEELAVRDFLAEGVEDPGRIELKPDGMARFSFDPAAALEGAMDANLSSAAVREFVKSLIPEGTYGWDYMDGAVVWKPGYVFWDAEYDGAGETLTLSCRSGKVKLNDGGTATLEATLELMTKEAYRVALADSVAGLVSGREYVTFGNWEQDGDADNGPEPIEWLTVESDGETATLISRYALTARAYHDRLAPVTWEGCALRRWLNDDFLNAAFSPEEQLRLERATVSAEDLTGDSFEDMGDPGSDTVDAVFIPDRRQYDQWFPSPELAKARPTEVALAEGAEHRGDGGECWWWLRPMGSAEDGGAGIWVDQKGQRWIGLDVSEMIGVRPVITVRMGGAGDS